MSRLRRVAPVLPVQEIGPSIAHYERLGFTASPYEATGGGAPVYCFLSSGDVELHLARVRTLDVHANTSACYIYVEDAQALHAAWTASGAGGRFTAPADTPYGLREFAHVDPDGNLIRVGSPLRPNRVGFRR